MFNFKHRLHDTHLMPTRFRGRVHQLKLRLSSAFSPKSVCQTLSWPDTRWKSAYFRLRWCYACCAQPLSARLQNGIRFFHTPIPAVPWVRLTARFPLSSTSVLE